mmetsp:Transcript_30385/g.71975  ORF Transcript_30385/g.71975 Transcript_30385/m.71975 type:complete len:231 (+) Transcript_30385:241-933(+)
MDRDADDLHHGAVGADQPDRGRGAVRADGLSDEGRRSLDDLALLAADVRGEGDGAAAEAAGGQAEQLQPHAGEHDQSARRAAHQHAPDAGDVDRRHGQRRGEDARGDAEQGERRGGAELTYREPGRAPHARAVLARVLRGLLRRRDERGGGAELAGAPRRERPPPQDLPRPPVPPPQQHHGPARVRQQRGRGSLCARLARARAAGPLLRPLLHPPLPRNLRQPPRLLLLG